MIHHQILLLFSFVFLSPGAGDSYYLFLSLKSDVFVEKEPDII